MAYKRNLVSRERICAYKYGRPGDLSAKSLSGVLGNKYTVHTLHNY